MAPQDAKKVEIIVTLEDDALEDVQSAVARLRDADLDVREVLQEIGQIVGHAAPERLDDLRQLRGVLDVSISGETSVPPPDDEVQ